MDVALVSAKATIIGVIIGVILTFVSGILVEKYKYSWTIKEDTRKERKDIYISLTNAISSLPNKIVPSTMNERELLKIQADFYEMLKKLKSDLEEYKNEGIDLPIESFEINEEDSGPNNMQEVLDSLHSFEKKFPPELMEQFQTLIKIAEQIKDRDEYLTNICEFIDGNWSEIQIYASREVKNLIVELVHSIKPFYTIRKTYPEQPDINKLKAINSKIIESIRKELKVD